MLSNVQPIRHPGKCLVVVSSGCSCQLHSAVRVISRASPYSLDRLSICKWLLNHAVSANLFEIVTPPHKVQSEFGDTIEFVQGRSNRSLNSETPVPPSRNLAMLLVWPGASPSMKLGEIANVR